MRTRLIVTAAVVPAIAASLCVGAVRADPLPAQNGGGCNMVWHLSKPGGDNMMAGSAHGEGAANMFDVLAASRMTTAVSAGARAEDRRVNARTYLLETHMPRPSAGGAPPRGVA